MEKSFDEIVPGYYKHFKGHLCRVIGVGKHTETEEEFVVYKHVADGKIWIRPKEMWNDTKKTPNGEEVKRFERVDPDNCETIPKECENCVNNNGFNSCSIYKTCSHYKLANNLQ